MHTRLVNSVAAPTSIYTLMGIGIKHIRAIQLEPITGTIKYGDQAVQAKALSALTEVLPLDNTKSLFLSGIGTVNVCIFV